MRVTNGLNKMGMIGEGALIHFAEIEEQLKDKPPLVLSSGVLSGCSVVVVRYKERNTGFARVLFAHAAGSVFTNQMIVQFEIVRDLCAGGPLVAALCHNGSQDSTTKQNIADLQQYFHSISVLDNSIGALYLTKNRLLVAEGHAGNVPNMLFPGEIQ